MTTTFDGQLPPHLTDDDHQSLCFLSLSKLANTSVYVKVFGSVLIIGSGNKDNYANRKSCCKRNNHGSWIMVQLIQKKISFELLKGVSSLVGKVRRRPRIWPMANECRPSVVDMAATDYSRCRGGGQRGWT
jgi:hypothetical protein